MSENTGKGKTIAIDHDAHEMIVTLSKLYELDHGKLVKVMAKYMLKYGVDPTVAPPNLAREIKNLDKRVVSFFREHESRHLIPLGNQSELILKGSQKIEQFLGYTKLGITISDEKIEMLKTTFNFYAKIIHNVNHLGIKSGIIERKEKIQLGDVLTFSEKLLKGN